LPILIVYKNIKSLIDEHEKSQLRSKELALRITQLEEKNTNLQLRETSFNQLMHGINAFGFLHHILDNKWLTFNKLHEHPTSNEENSLEGLGIIEDLLHPDDKGHFHQKKAEWLTGIPTKVEFRVVLPDGQIRWKQLSTNSIVNSNGKLEKTLGFVIDITNFKEKEEKLSQMAFYDNLTLLPNRTMLKSHIRKVLSRAKRRDHKFVVMFIDLDGFKEVNDTLGHDIGDALLKEVANRLNDSVREEDLISRIGGDEFILVFEETDQEEVSLIANRIVENISTPYLILEEHVEVTPSIGLSIYPKDGMDIESLMKNADKAMYFAKNNGKGYYQFYDTILEDFKPNESLVDKFLNWFKAK
jgi:diguanylate cyclase